MEDRHFIYFLLNQEGPEYFAFCSLKQVPSLRNLREREKVFLFPLEASTLSKVPILSAYKVISLKDIIFKKVHIFHLLHEVMVNDFTHILPYFCVRLSPDEVSI